MSFIFNAAGAIVLILFGALVSSGAIPIFASGVVARFAFGGAALLAQFWLFCAALYIRARSTGRFDVAVAAETLVALGVFSLITGIAVAVVTASHVQMTGGSTTLRDFEPLLIRFGEALLASAVAPLLATLLRQIEVIRFSSEVGGTFAGGDLSALTKALERAAKALSEVEKHTGSINEALEAVATGLSAIVGTLSEVSSNIEQKKTAIPDVLATTSASIQKSGDLIPTELSHVGTQIHHSGDHVRDALKKAADEVQAASNLVAGAFVKSHASIAEGANKMSAEFERVAGRISTESEKVGVSLNAFKSAADGGVASVNDLATKLKQLAVDSHELSGLMRRLQELIDSVSDFLRPEKK